jgi:hypothetical protein
MFLRIRFFFSPKVGFPCFVFVVCLHSGHTILLSRFNEGEKEEGEMKSHISLKVLHILNISYESNLTSQVL